MVRGPGGSRLRRLVLVVALGAVVPGCGCVYYGTPAQSEVLVSGRCDFPVWGAVISGSETSLLFKELDDVGGRLNGGEEDLARDGWVALTRRIPGDDPFVDPVAREDERFVWLRVAGEPVAQSAPLPANRWRLRIGVEECRAIAAT